ncbi:uncharacterized protein LOC136042249 isoform X2 [Artemia franciscana]|uniref:uncharacterized protein LOC136042249 isoform X2 n=1 Tax=Artemia franciscana TaxID=6661 RepID=UPI0032DB410F
MNDHLKMTVLERSSNIEDLNQDLDANLKDAVRIKEELFKAYIKFNAHQEQKSELEESLVLAIRRGDEYEKNFIMINERMHTTYFVSSKPQRTFWPFEGLGLSTSTAGSVSAKPAKDWKEERVSLNGNALFG